MKTSILCRLAALLLLGSAACQSLDDAPALRKIVPSQLHDFPVASFVLENPGATESVLFTAAWTETLFYLGGDHPTPAAPVRYTLQIDRAGSGFETPRNLGTTTSLAMKVQTRPLNLLLLDSLGAKAGEPIGVELRLIVRYGQGTVREIASANTLALRLTPYQDSDPLQPLYIIGDANGWNTSDTRGMIPLFKENSASTNRTYTFTGYFPAGGFKLLPAEAVGTSTAYCDNGDGTMVYAASGDAFRNETPGFRTLTVNLRTLAYSFEAYDASGARTWNVMGFIGEFCNWENEPAMTRWSSANSHLWRLDYTLPPLGSEGIHPVKFRAERSWDSRWAAIDPEALPYGRTMFLTADEADPNVNVREEGAYEIVFNDLTGHYIIRKK